MPEVVSLPLQVIATEWLNQPFWSAARAAAAETLVGAVASNLSGKEAAAEFPAWSVQVPLGAALPESGPLYDRGAVHEARPESESDPAQLTVTAWLYQPFTSGPRAALAATVGAVSSNFRASETEELVFPALSV